MNEIYLAGVMRNIQHSHSIGNVEYNKANLIVTRKDGKEDIINILFKSYNNAYEDNSRISLRGNIRSYSTKMDSRNKVDIYVFTHLDKVTDELDVNNRCDLSGRICIINKMHKTSNGKPVIHFTLANNIIKGNKIINSYIPCVAWGKLAEIISNYKVNDEIAISGELHSREYRKMLNDSEYEIKVAHELVITEIKDEI